VFRFDARFPGQWFDVETGLFQNGYRDYDPRTGRYVQSDPIGLGGGWNTYAYVGGQVTGAVDPEGLTEKDYKKTIPALLDQGINEMIIRGWRRPGLGLWNAAQNNFQSGYNNYKVCIGQAAFMDDFMNEKARKGAFESRWIFKKNGSWWHHWAYGVSSDPSDPLVMIDSWTGEIKYGTVENGFFPNDVHDRDWAITFDKILLMAPDIGKNNISAGEAKKP
jgi:RHS repeat-associated protein